MNWTWGILIGCTALVGCEDQVTFPVEKDGVSNPDVYVLGTRSDDWQSESNLIGCVLNDSVSFHFGDAVQGYYGHDMYLDETGIYLTGSRYWGESMLWKNESIQNNSQDWNSVFESMQVVQGHSYVAGFEWLDNGYEQATLWKDGVPVHLPLSDPDFDYNRAFDVAVSGSDVYVVGWEFDVNGATAHNAIVWKNGVPQVLPAVFSIPSGAESARPMAVAVSGNDIYVAGYAHDPTTGYPSAVYWKNGKPKILEQIPGGNNMTWAMDIFIYGSDIHIAGHDGQNGIHWKNFKAVKLPASDQEEANPSLIWDVTSIVVFEGDVYISGTESGHGIYWKNGVPKILPSLVMASCVFVTRFRSPQLP